MTRTTAQEFYLSALNTISYASIKPTTGYIAYTGYIASYNITVAQANNIYNLSTNTGVAFGITSLFSNALVTQNAFNTVDTQDNIITDYIRYLDSLTFASNKNTLNFVSSFTNTKSLAQDLYNISNTIENNILTYKNIYDAFENSNLNSPSSSSYFISGDKLYFNVTIHSNHESATREYRVQFVVGSSAQSTYPWSNTTIFSNDNTLNSYVFGSEQSYDYPYQQKAVSLTNQAANGVTSYAYTLTDSTQPGYQINNAYS